MAVNIAESYLMTLESDKSRVSMGSYLNVAADFLREGSDRDTFDRASLRYTHLH